MIFSIVFILLISIGIGLPLSLLLNPKGNFAENGGLSFPLGIGIFTLLLFLINLAGLKFSLMNSFCCFLISSAPLIAFARTEMKKYFKEVGSSIKHVQLTAFEKTMLIILSFLVVSSFINTLYWPVYSWDALTLYDFRAHIFVMTGFARGMWITGGYPLLTSLAHTIVYLWGGNNPQYIYSLFYLSFGIAFYGNLREFITRKLSLFFTLVLLSVPIIFEHSMISYTNLPFTIYFGLGTIIYYISIVKNRIGSVFLSGLLVGLSAWTRSIEPLWIGVLFVVVVISLYRKKPLEILIFLLAFLPIKLIWNIF